MDSEEVNECHHCGEEFSSAADFKEHLKTHEKTAAPSQSGVDLMDKGGKTHECFHCGEGFDSVSDLDNHMKTHDAAKNQTVVNTPSDDSAGFVDLTEDGDDPHECFHCGEEFDKEDLLNSHLMVRHHVKPHRCTQCGEGFMHDYQLKAHELVHKDVSPKVLSDVEMMYKSYSNSARATASTHHEEHTNAASTSQTEHECPECGKCFKTAGALGTHKLMHNAKVIHKCTYCGKIFTRPSDLKRHIVTHTGERAHSCHLCPKKFAQALALYNHLRQSHRTKPWVCSTCGEGFDMMTDLKAHQKTHRNEDKSYVVPRKKPYLSQETDEGDLYTCPQCGDSFTEETALNIHSQIHMRDTIEITPQAHNCPRCSMMFDDEAELNRHIMVCIPSAEDVSVHVKQENTVVSNLNVNYEDVVDLTLDDDEEEEEEVDRYKCVRCDESFRLEVELNAHLIMLHSTPDTHECFHCGEEFDTEDELKLHILRSHKVKTPLEHHKCPDCDMTFLLLSDFQNHKEQRHHQCKICGHKFYDKRSIEHHMRVMHGGGSYLCAHCKEAFQTRALLKTHMETQHTKQGASPSTQQDQDNISDKVRSHKCLQCDQSFTTKSQLYKHCETHLDIQPRPTVYKCYCGMKFSNPDDLERHKVTHGDVVDLTFDEDETYKCSFCDDVYSREEELIVHMMMHPKQEPFECGECGKKFVFEKDYRFHLRTHVKAESGEKTLPTDTGNKTQSGDKPHQCPVCQKRFSSLAVLQRHEATHGSEPHKCHHCGAGFWHVHVLQRHLEKDCSKAQNGKPPGASSSPLVAQELKITSSPSPVSMNGSKVQQVPAGIIPQEIVPQGIAPIKNEVYTCCGWSFMSEADMKLHELSHKVTVYKCVQCKQVFRSIANLETHMKTHSEASSPRKAPSHDDSSTSSTLTAPSTSYIEDEHHKCLQCGKKFRTAGFLNKHMQLHKAQLHKADKVHRCKECGQKFLSLAGLTRHALAHNDKKPNQCPVCNENFNNSAKLFEHMATHDGRNTHTCKQCGKTFKRLTSLNSHMRMHAEEDNDGLDDDPSEDVEMLDIQEPNVSTSNIPRPNILEPNGARPMPSSIDLTDLKEEEEEDEQGYMCTYCGRRFDKEKNLKVHFRTHMKSTSTTYYETKVKFSDAAGKELRIVTRLRKKRCKCYLCFKMFRRPSDLARHMMIHTGERPCKCNFCPAGFIQISHLKAHTLKFHKDIPPQSEEESLKHKQETAIAVAKAKLVKRAKNISSVTKHGRLPGWLCCGLRFTSSLEIQHHWLVHNEEEAYPCPHCDLKFTKGFTRTKHIMAKHSGAKPNCLDCGKEFATFQDLKAHMKVHEAQLEQTVPDAPSTDRVEVYTDVADSEPASTNNAEVYTDEADASSVLVKTEVIPDYDEEDPDEAPALPKLDNILHTAPDPLLLKKEGSQNSDPDLDHEEDPVSLKKEAMMDTDAEVVNDAEVDPKTLKKEARMDTDAEIDNDVDETPIALKKETGMDTTDDPSSPIDDAVLDSEPEENSTSLNDKMDIDPASQKGDASADTEVDPSGISIVDVLSPVPVLLNQYRCLHCGDKFSVREHLIPHISKHTDRNYSSCNACKMGFLRKEELKVHLATHFMYPS